MICRPDFRIAIALLLGSISLAGCDETASELSAIDAARAELAQGNWLAAQINLEAALESGVSREDVAALFGEAELQEGDFASARAWLGPGQFSPETQALGFRMLGRLEMSDGNLPAAGRAFDSAYRADPDNAELWVDIGRLRYRGGEQVQAIEAAERALELDPEDAQALRFRGQLARDADGLEAGARLLGRALEKLPQDIDLRVEYAATLGDAGLAKAALQTLRAGDAAAAVTPKGLFVQSVIAARGGNISLARDLLQRSELEQQGVQSAELLSAIIDLEAGNSASATQSLDRLYQRQPDNRRVRDLFAFALSRIGGERELIDRFAEDAIGPSGSTYLRTLVGRAYEAIGEREAAARFLDLAAHGNPALSVLPSRSSPQDPDLSDRRSAVGTRDFVRHAIAGRDNSGGVGRARELARLLPGSADAFSILGDAEFAAGNKPAARTAYERSAAVRRPWPLALRLAGVLQNAGAVKGLLVAYVRDNPMNGEAVAILADAYAAEGDWDRAVTLLDHAMGLGMERVPWVLAARSIGALQQGDSETALAFALAAHELQPMNPLVVSALIEALPEEEVAARSELQAKLRSLIQS